AVSDALNKYLKQVELAQDVLNSNNKRRDETTAAKTERFQHALDDVVMRVQSELLPVLIRLAPKALQLVDSFGKVATWAAENPFKAVAAALGASLLRAGIES